MDAFVSQMLMRVLSTPKTRQQLLEEINIPDRTLRYNLSILKKQKLVREIFMLGDMRRKVFLLEDKGGGNNE